MTIQTVCISIERSSPTSIDPAFSSRGHETGPKLWLPAGGTDDDITEFLQINAPEVDLSQPRVQVTELGSYSKYGFGPDNRDYYFLTGRDRRGYRTNVYVQVTYRQEEIAA